MMNTSRYVVISIMASLVCLMLFLLFVYKHQRRDYPLSYMIKHADFVGISQYGSAQDGTLVGGPGIITLRKDKNPDILFLVKASGGFHSTPLSSAADYIVDLQSYKDNRHTEGYSYIIATGELGRDHDWCYVPAAFKAWMKTLPKPHHAKYTITRTLWYENVQEVQ